MRLISADFNAMTEAGHVRLTLPCSREDILRMSLGPGDWAWLSDGEILVGGATGHRRSLRTGRRPRLGYPRAPGR